MCICSESVIRNRCMSLESTIMSHVTDWGGHDLFGEGLWVMKFVLANKDFLVSQFSPISLLQSSIL